MSRASTARRKSARPASPKVLVFGEDPHDSESLRHIIEALRPELAGRILPLRRPLVLIKNARPETLPDRAKLFEEVVAANSVGSPVLAVVAHEDADDLEPGHVAVELKIHQTLRRLPCPVVPAVPAWELEAWFFLWPEQVRSVRPRSWQAPTSHVGRNVGKIKDAKEALQRAVRPRQANRSPFPEYRESDAPSIALKIKEAGVVNHPEGRSDSFESFRSRIAQL